MEVIVTSWWCFVFSQSINISIGHSMCYGKAINNIIRRQRPRRTGQTKRRQNMV